MDKSNAAYSSSSALKVGRFPVNEVKKEKKKKRVLGLKSEDMRTKDKGGVAGVFAWWVVACICGV